MCIFGTIANLLNIAVLTRKEMNGSPINRILTGEATKKKFLPTIFLFFSVLTYAKDKTLFIFPKQITVGPLH